VATATPAAPTAPPVPVFLPTVALIPPALIGDQTGCVDLLLNSDFETNAGWLFSPSITPPQYTTAQRQSGARAMQLGVLPGSGANRASYSSIRQPLTIPTTANRVLLTWWQWAGTEEALTTTPGATADRQEVLLLDATGRAVALIQQQRQTDSGWQQWAADLSSYRGQQLTLYFNVYNDGNGLSTWLYLDGVVLLACGVPVTPTPTATLVYVTPTPIVATATPTNPGGVTNTPTTLPGVTNTPTTVAACRELVVNGGFESNSNWILGQSRTPAQYTTAQKQAGALSLQLGRLTGSPPLAGSSFSSARQSVAIPATANYVTLRWWQWAGTAEAAAVLPDTNSDRQEVLLLTPAEQVLAVLQRTRQNSIGWQEQQVDLSPYRGRTVDLYFNVYNDGNGLATWLYLDEVSLLDCPTPPTAAPTATPTVVVVTATPTLVVVTATPTATGIPPTATPTPTATVGTPSDTPTPTATPTETGTPTVTLVPGTVSVTPTATIIPGATSTPVTPTPIIHRVQQGDRLVNLARQYYDGNASLWTLIYDANRAVIGNNPSVLPIGADLIIPPTPTPPSP
jgi:nucleoid-associated protein YgaU